MRRRIRVFGVVAVLAGLLSACGATSGSPPATTAAATHGGGGIVTISNESGSTWTCGFNPFNPSVQFLSLGTVYEPLAFVDSLENAKVTPWLATTYAWSAGNTVLTWTIRSGVKWSDGVPLTAADVAYTFNLMKAKPALDLNAVWTVLKSVTQQGDQVVMTFKAPSVTYFYYIADQVGIVPEHIWSKVANPVTWADSNPIGSGPFTMAQCTPENVKYLKNPDYWQPGLPKIAQVDYPSFLSNTPANDELADGTAQWGAQFIPSIQAVYASKSPDFHYWFPPTVNVDVFFNLKDSILALPVRQAIAYAIDRSRVSEIGEYGYEPPANQTGIVTPTFSSWEDTSEAASYGNDYAYNPGKAISTLEAAGYKKGSNGIFVSPSGQPLSFSIINIGGYSDWVADVQIITSELAAVGIGLTAQDLSSTNYDTDLYDGSFQLAYGEETGGPTPYYEQRQELFSGNSAPIGQAASTDWERYSNPTTDALLNEYATTTSSATQHSIVDQLQQVMLSDVPLIPIAEGVDWYEYDTQNLGGWPTQSNAYAQPAAWNLPDIEVVLLHLYQK
jgi:peptide/nickel transport system substrate-binding protein